MVLKELKKVFKGAEEAIASGAGKVVQGIKTIDSKTTGRILAPADKKVIQGVIKTQEALATREMVKDLKPQLNKIEKELVVKRRPLHKIEAKMAEQGQQTLMPTKTKSELIDAARNRLLLEAGKKPLTPQQITALKLLDDEQSLIIQEETSSTTYPSTLQKVVHPVATIKDALTPKTIAEMAATRQQRELEAKSKQAADISSLELAIKQLAAEKASKDYKSGLGNYGLERRFAELQRSVIASKTPSPEKAESLFLPKYNPSYATTTPYSPSIQQGPLLPNSTLSAAGGADTPYAHPSDSTLDVVGGKQFVGANTNNVLDSVGGEVIVNRNTQNGILTGVGGPIVIGGQQNVATTGEGETLEGVGGPVVKPTVPNPQPPVVPIVVQAPPPTPTQVPLPPEVIPPQIEVPTPVPPTPVPPVVAPLPETLPVAEESPEELPRFEYTAPKPRMSEKPKVFIIKTPLSRKRVRKDAFGNPIRGIHRHRGRPSKAAIVARTRYYQMRG